jgi:nitrogen fixation NifU-like protein
MILDHSAHPHHHGTLENATPIEMNNPTCGDVIHLSLLIEEGKIKDIAFDGSGCSISTASASMMTDVVIGKEIEIVLEMADSFSKMVQGETVENIEELLGDASLLSGVAKFPARIKCSTLAWKALEKAIAAGESQTSQGNLAKHEEGEL